MSKFLQISGKFFFLGLLIFSTLSCEPEEDSYTDDGYSGGDNGSGYYGNWKRNDGSINTYVKFYGTTAVTCNNGTETYGSFDSSEPSMTYNIEGNIIKFPLQFDGDNLLVGVPNQALETHNASPYIRTSGYCTSSGDGNGDGNGNGDGDGNLMFWTQSDLGCGMISVEISNYSGTISSYYSGGAPSCGASGSANFTLPEGNYSFSASCSGYTWNGSVSVSSGGCSKMELTL
ncbi:MAG TPA: hypothetical protein VFM70_06960 [Salinimicrobium sp.]|nr:hypothetical protein [Salinimicrobium sp.]